ncbi:uncharacterized protein LOC105738331 [Nomascus leucogenys]|uniref:uncharacterized protein LOC105738331 n=1 Tax=Nomascus leucogenys TaxID=61853 RepID=UPI00122D5A44|nr:uncharacterized protein LOC105738331 [Nomascus leucogenys]
MSHHTQLNSTLYVQESTGEERGQEKQVCGDRSLGIEQAFSLEAQRPQRQELGKENCLRDEICLSASKMGEMPPMESSHHAVRNPSSYIERPQLDIPAVVS